MMVPKNFVPTKDVKELKDMDTIPSMSLEEFLKTKKEGKLKGYYAHITGLEELAIKKQKDTIEDYIRRSESKISYYIETTYSRTGCFWRESTYSIHVKMFESFDETLVEELLDLIERHEDESFALVLGPKALNELKRSILYEELNKKVVKVAIDC